MTGKWETFSRDEPPPEQAPAAEQLSNETNIVPNPPLPMGQHMATIGNSRGPARIQQASSGPSSAVRGRLGGVAGSPASSGKVGGPGRSGTRTGGGVAAGGLPAFYLRAVKQRVEANFTVPPNLKTSAQCSVQFTIFRDGQIGNVLLAKSAGSSLLDDLALKALWKTGQLGLLPDTFPGQYIVVLLTFDYNQ